MAFDNAKNDFNKQHIYIVEIDIETCDLTYGIAPCTASGDDALKCFNTLKTCQDKDNIVYFDKTYTFCTSVSPLPVSLPFSDGFSTIPSVDSVSIAPSAIDINGGLGGRASATVTFLDHPYSDIGIDNYLGGRTYIASENGSFWTKFIARNPFYKNAAIRISTGYIENGVYSAGSFVTYNYIIESLSISGGKCKIVAKDILKLADNKSAQAPRPSIGVLQSDIAASIGVVEFDIIPSSEYSISDYIRIGAEVMKIDNIVGDTFTVFRATDASNGYTSTLDEHSNGDVAQLCLEYAGSTVDVISSDLLINYANVPSLYINSAEWAGEMDDNSPSGMSTLITEPVGVNELLKELGKSSASYLFWDAISQQIIFTTIKTPPIYNNVSLTDSRDLIENPKISANDKLRISTVFFYYGQLDPTKKLDERNNYKITYVREDSDSVNNYSSRKIETIFSRWIVKANSVAAINSAARRGRRFAEVPRQIDFKMDVKNSDTKTGDTVFVETNSLVDEFGAATPTAFQIISSTNDKSDYKYRGLEYGYGQALSQDEDSENPDLFILQIAATDAQSYDIKTQFDFIYPSAVLDGTKTVRLIILSNVTQGSSLQTIPAITTGAGFNGAELVIENRSFIVGRGGDGFIQGGSIGFGGVAISLGYNITLRNYGVIGGGGGSGGGLAAGYVLPTTGYGCFLDGGAGAGHNFGVIGNSSASNIPDAHITAYGTNGSLELGGQETTLVSFNDIIGSGGAGGDLGQDGAVAFDNMPEIPEADRTITVLPPFPAGKAIELNGFTVNYEEAGDIRGVVS